MTREDAVSKASVFEILGNLMSIPYDFDRQITEKDVSESMDEIKALPPVTPIRPKGHWIEIAQYSDGKHKIECSECKGLIFSRGHANSFNVKNEYKFCPHCGKRMIDPQERNDKE